MRKLSTDLIKSGSFTGSFSGSFVGLINSSSYSQTASFSLNTFSLTTGSTYSITSSWSNNSVSSSFSRNSISSSYSNTASNLSPVAQDLIPITGSTYSLGSVTNKWKDLYVSTGSIYIGDTVLTTSGSTLYANVQPIVTLNTASGQIEVSGITASLSASFATNAGTINNTSSNVFATTGSNTFNGTQTVQGDIRVIGNLIAQQYVVSSSVSYFTSSNFDGSTKFGDSALDTHQFTGSVLAPNITGSLLGSSSYSTTSSVALTALTSSYINIATNAVSSSYAATSSYILNAVSSSFSNTSSLANTASYVLNSVSSSFASTSSYNLNSVSSSYSLTSSYAANAGSSLVTGSTYPITSSWSNNSISSSYATNAGASNTATSANSSTSASYALTASFAANAGSSLTTGSTYPITSSWSNNSVSSSYALNSSTATSATSATTATSSSFASTSSYVANTVSSSYALTASYAMNGGSGGGSTPVVSVASLNNQTILYNFSSSQEATITGLTLTNNNWGINVVEEWNSGSGDVYYPSCSLLCHFDSLNSSGSFIDNSSNNFNITSSGDAKLSTSQYKFGGASAYFDGANDYLLIQDNNAFELGSSDFTIETFVYFVTLPSTNGYQSTIISKWSSSNNSYEIYLYNNAGTYQLYLTYSTNGTTSTNLGVNWTPNIGQWYHIACVRSSTNVYFWVNGVQQGATQSISGTLYNGTAQLEIGGFGLGSANTVLNGYLDDLRITKGIARYTASFTPPSFAFPNSATQIATKYIGLVGGLNDSNVDYGIEKLSDSSLKIKKLTDTQQPSGSFLSSSVDRVYVNVLNYTNVSVGSTLLGQTFTALGSTSSYSLSRSVINPYEIVVAVDGAVQSFNDAYSVTSSTINFTETIPSGSLVDIRYLTTPNVNSASYALTSSFAQTTPSGKSIALSFILG